MNTTTKVYNDILYDKRLTLSAIRLISYIIRNDDPSNLSRKQVLEDVNMNVDTYKASIKRLFECEYLEKRDDAPYGIVKWKLNDI